ncbi:pyroglutamyl-peptidase I [Candidatus Izimaplasma bacterium ZiA1]|uniref:pyroglutamyl-peptidase I n=1 Tax=Candidatus Izimoplasma sp. ZiA1 TaxID=2024899 RepID=UPI000BAA8BA8|nr:pyroglutamyl-peptidase I [Candidatus Izimaplasma bacterium ZiA1]
MKYIIVTGFEPFLGEEINPSLEVLKLLPDTINGYKIIKKGLPVIFNKCFNEIPELINEYNPKYIIHIGQAGGRSKITPERVAINIDDTCSVDNENKTYTDVIIKQDGEKAYFSSIPIKKIVERLKQKSIPASISNSAGTYVCNNLLYNSLYYIDKNSLDIKAGFIHIPFTNEQVVNKGNIASMNLSDIKIGIETILEVITSE